MIPPMNENPIVFFDITIGGSSKGRIEMELHADIVPRTAEVKKSLFFFSRSTIVVPHIY
jgi:hypothetical protein